MSGLKRASLYLPDMIRRDFQSCPVSGLRPGKPLRFCGLPRPQDSSWTWAILPIHSFNYMWVSGFKVGGPVADPGNLAGVAYQIIYIINIHRRILNDASVKIHSSVPRLKVSAVYLVTLWINLGQIHCGMKSLLTWWWYCSILGEREYFTSLYTLFPFVTKSPHTLNRFIVLLHLI